MRAIRGTGPPLGNRKRPAGGKPGALSKTQATGSAGENRRPAPVVNTESPRRRPTQAELRRETFRTSRLLEFCSKKELIAQTGHDSVDWPLVILKELVDNALDACEEAGIAPEITIEVSTEPGGAAVIVADNGHGIPPETVADIIDYSIRVSSREAYVSPTRGAQGNALKTILAMPFALDGTTGVTTIAARGIAHGIAFKVDQLRQVPVILHRRYPSAVAKGTRKSLARPGGNVTGMAGVGAELAGKSVELIRDMVPSARRVAALANAPDPFSKPFLEQIRLGGSATGTTIDAIMIHGAEELEAAFPAMEQARPDAVIVQPSLPTKRAAELALKYRIPAVSGIREFVEAGGLLGYVAAEDDMYRRAAVFVDKILKGAKPADLPVEQPNKFELLVNLKTAKAIG
jgi:hypothetical protein